VITLLDNEGAHAHTSMAAVDHPAGLVVGERVGDSSTVEKTIKSKGPVVDGTFFYRTSVNYRRSSDTPSPSRTLT
jgi:hypothetical protein